MKISGSIRRFLPKSAFAKSVSILVGGTAAVQAIVVLESPKFKFLIEAQILWNGLNWGLII